MMRAQLDAASVAQIRVAPSPVLEAVMWLGLTAAGARHPVYGDPGPAARFALRDPDVAAAAALTTDLVSRRYLPDFLTPKPASIAMDRVLSEQLERIRAVPAPQAHHQLVDTQWGSGTMARGMVEQVGRDALPAVVAAGVWKFWRTVLADQWSDLRRALSAWACQYGRRSAEAGIGAALDDLHPKLSWAGDAVLVDCPYEETIRFVDAELVLIPTALSLPYTSVVTDDLDDAFIAFPVRTARPLEPRRRDPSAVLGRGRSSVLVGLSCPRTTRQLARTIGLSESAVSHHLHALADADLVRSTRRGREVVYRLTVTGHELRAAVNA